MNLSRMISQICKGSKRIDIRLFLDMWTLRGNVSPKGEEKKEKIESGERVHGAPMF